MKTHSRLSLLLLVACSSAGSDELFPTAVRVPEAAPPGNTDGADANRLNARGVPPLDRDDPALDDSASAPDETPDSDGPGTPALSDDVPPSLSGTQPEDGADGVTAQTEIVLKFSETMDRDSTRAMLRSEDGPVAAAEEWRNADRELHLAPLVPLAYADGGADTAPMTYVVHVADGARDAAGNPLPAQTFSFHTLRRVTEVLLPSSDAALTGSWRGDASAGAESCVEGAICAGDDSFSADPEASAQYRGFLSFDLSRLPAPLVEVVEARIRIQASDVRGDPFGVLGKLRLERAAFDAVGPAAFEAAPQATFAALRDSDERATGEHILWAVQEDLASDGLHQYRLSFDRGSNRDAAADVAIFAPEDQRLEITYLIP